MIDHIAYLTPDSLRAIAREPWQLDRKTKKADVAEHPEVFHHVGLLIDEPPDIAGLPFIQSSEIVCIILPCPLRKATGI